jgi:hypothetical protein
MPGTSQKGPAMLALRPPRALRFGAVALILLLTVAGMQFWHAPRAAAAVSC